MKPLSPRQMEVVKLMAEGHGSVAIGERLCMEPQSVRHACKRIYDQLDLNVDHPAWKLIALYIAGKIPTKETPATS